MQLRLPRTDPDASYAELVVSVVVAWGICDGVSTLLAAALVGAAFETNPLVRTLLPTPSLAFSVKLGATVFAGALALAGERFITTVPGWRLYFAGLIGLGIGVTGLNVVAVIAVL